MDNVKVKFHPAGKKNIMVGQRQGSHERKEHVVVDKEEMEGDGCQEGRCFS